MHYRTGLSQQVTLIHFNLMSGFRLMPMLSSHIFFFRKITYFMSTGCPPHSADMFPPSKNLNSKCDLKEKHD